jgi:uncharacterized protein YdcH (DUF465 family)
MANKPLTPLERIKSVSDLAVKSGFPVKKVFDIYNKLNEKIYKQNNIHEFYNPELEEMTFSMVKSFLERLN